MQELRKGHASAKSTLLITYSSLPPVVLFSKAFRAGHYLLAFLSILSLLSNVLTVSMAALFTQYDATVASTIIITHSKVPSLALMKDSDYPYMFDHQQDSIYTVTTNFSGLTKLPTWTTTNYSHLPIRFTAVAPNIQSPELEYETIGYGADLYCVDSLTIHPNQSAQFKVANFGNESALFFGATVIQRAIPFLVTLKVLYNGVCPRISLKCQIMSSVHSSFKLPYHDREVRKTIQFGILRPMNSKSFSRGDMVGGRQRWPYFPTVSTRPRVVTPTSSTMQQ
jgi:hypothetical protein